MTPSRSSVTSADHAAHSAGTVSPQERTALWTMEESFWTGDMDNARATTARGAVMIFPQPAGILQGEQLWVHLPRRTGWRTVVMSERRIMLFGDIAILSYQASAEKADVPIYKAFCASTYLHDDETWVRTSHQQTPLH